MGLGGAYSSAMRTLSPEQLALMAASRKLVNQLNDQKAKHEAELAALQTENGALRERLRACDNVNRLIAEVARGDPSVLTRGSQ
jgi:hypothetical protein